MKIGVLALQGAFIEHTAMLRKLEVNTCQVRLPQDLAGLDGLIIPGGESSTISKLMIVYDLMDELKALAEGGLPILGTCAGMILLAKEVTDTKVQSLRIMDIKVRRNAFGRQLNSFETDMEVPALGDGRFHATFIRAPVIEEAGPRVEILARLPDGRCVAARQGNLVATAFHPELTTDLRFHSYFLDIATRNGICAN